MTQFEKRLNIKTLKFSFTSYEMLLFLFYYSAFFLLALKKPSPEAFLWVLGFPLLLAICNMLFRQALHFDPVLISAVNFLSGLGILMISRFDLRLGTGQLFNYISGMILLFLMSHFVKIFRGLKRWSFMLGLLSLGLMALPILFGREINGAKAWINVLGIGFQPSEIVKIFYVIILASLLSEKRYFIAAFFLSLVLGLLLLQKDLGTALIYYAVTVIVLFATSGSVRLLIGAGLGLLVGSYGGYTLFKHVKKRFRIWIDPWADRDGAGYQIVQTLIAIANGGLWGTGLGLGNANVIPEHQTDFIFAVILNEFGVIFGVFVIFLYLIFLFRVLFIVQNAERKFIALLPLAAGSLIAIQAFVIIGGNIKLIPLTGVTLPFVSYGGSSMLSSMGLLGIIQGGLFIQQANLNHDISLYEMGENL